MARNFVRASSQMLEYGAAVLTAAPLTMACWTKPTTINTAQIAMSINTSGTNTQRFVLGASGGSGTPFIHAHEGATNQSSNGPTLAVIGTWLHLAAVFASTTNRILYMDGVAGTTGTTAVTPTGMNRTTIGRNTSTNINHYDGDLAEAAIWNVALTAADLAQLVRGFSPMLVRPDALVAYWPLMGRNSPEDDLIGRQEMVDTNTTTANHPRVVRPRPSQAQFWGATAVSVGAYRLVGRPVALAGTGGLAG